MIPFRSRGAGGKGSWLAVSSSSIPWGIVGRVGEPIQPERSELARPIEEFGLETPENALGDAGVEIAVGGWRP